MTNRPTVLMVSPVVPASTGNGLAMRAAMTLRALAHHYRVRLLILNRYPSTTGPIKTELSSLCEMIETLQHGEDPRTVRGPLFSGTDVVHFFRLSTFAFATQWPIGGSPIHLDFDDVESQSRPEIARVMRSRDRIGEARLEERLGQTALDQEIAAIQIANRVYVASELDRERLPYCGEAEVRVLPNVIDLPDGAGIDSRIRHIPQNLLFVGTLGYFPNEDGVLWFAEDVIPILRALTSGPFRVTLAGHHSGRVRKLNEVPEVHVLGWAADLDALYRNADVMIIPLRCGGGTRIKLLEAAAHRLPIVTTTLGAEGIDVVTERHCLIADEAETFATGCERLMSDPTLGARLSSKAWEMIQIRYTLPAMVAALTP